MYGGKTEPVRDRWNDTAAARSWRVGVLVVTFAVLVVVMAITVPAAAPAHAQSQELIAQYERVRALYAKGKYTEAIPLAEEVMRRAEVELGTSNPRFADALAVVASLYHGQGRLTEAEPLYKRSLAIEELAFGISHQRVAKSLRNLALLYSNQRRLAEAEPLLKRVLAIREAAFGVNHSAVASSVFDLALLYLQQDRYSDAEPLFKRALTIWEKLPGTGHTNVEAALRNLAKLYELQGLYAEAEPHYKRALALWEKAIGPDHANVALSLYELAFLYSRQGRHKEAEPLLSRSLAIGGPEFATKVLSRGGLWTDTTRADKAETLRALALVYFRQGRYNDAEAVFKLDLLINETAFGSDSPFAALIHTRIGDTFRARHQYAEAERYYKHGLALYEKHKKEDSVGTTQSQLGAVYFRQNRFTEAEHSFKHALTIAERGLDKRAQTLILNRLGLLERSQGRWAEAMKYFRRGAGLLTAERDDPDRIGPLYGQVEHDLFVNRSRDTPQVYFNLTSAALVLARLEPTHHDGLSAEAFETMQVAQHSTSAEALAKAAVRFAAGRGPLSEAVRERQDLVQQLWKLNREDINRETTFRDKGGKDKLRLEISAAGQRLVSLKARIANDFPKYAEFSSMKPLSIREAQDLLAPDEALVVLLIDSKFGEAFVWAVTREGVTWRTIGAKDIAAKVAALRRGLDSEDLKKTLFDLALAHELYSTLLRPIEDTIKGKRHLIIVPSGALTSLPFHVLVTDRSIRAPTTLADLGAYRDAAWLVRRHGITVLPAVSSLKTLRQYGRGGRAEKAFIGFGNPLLLGPSGTDRSAFAAQSCGDQPRVGERRLAARATVTTPISRFFRGSVANLEILRRQSPLPDTTDELCTIAASVGVPSSEVHLGARATEAAIKTLSANGVLARYRVVHFATHGIMAGELEGLAEPALLLTPPGTATEADDGLLTASEVTQLKLNADWVVLSACNTAAGDGGDAEALSGLARAFFYAGARALLVSHWPVYSDAAVKLTTNVFAAMEADANIGRAEALRRAMLALIGDADPVAAHPAFWAPFVVVGEGAR